MTTTLTKRAPMMSPFAWAGLLAGGSGRPGGMREGLPGRAGTIPISSLRCGRKSGFGTGRPLPTGGRKSGGTIVSSRYRRSRRCVSGAMNTRSTKKTRRTQTRIRALSARSFSVRVACYGERITFWRRLAGNASGPSITRRAGILCADCMIRRLGFFAPIVDGGSITESA